MYAVSFFFFFFNIVDPPSSSTILHAIKRNIVQDKGPAYGACHSTGAESVHVGVARASKQTPCNIG